MSLTSLPANLICVLTCNGTASSDGNKLGSNKQRNWDQGSVFRILSSLRSERVTNILSTSGGRRALFPSSRRPELFWRPHSLLFGRYWETFTQQFSGRVVKVTTSFDLMPMLRTHGDTHTLSIRLRHLNRESLWSKPTTNQSSEIWFSVSDIHNDSCIVSCSSLEIGK